LTENSKWRPGTVKKFNFFICQVTVDVSVSFYVKIYQKRRWWSRFFDISKTNRV